MREFLRAELERLAARPSIDGWLREVRIAVHWEIGRRQFLPLVCCRRRS
jgi:hypothetical protein